jgi:hypothetical protein
MSASSDDANRQTEHDAAHREHRIRERAFFLWQEAGSPEGREEEFWHRAEGLEQGGTMSSSQADPTGQNEAPEPVEERDAAANAAGQTGAVPTGRIETSLNRP